MKRALFTLLLLTLSTNVIYAAPTKGPIINHDPINFAGKKAITQLPQKSVSYSWDSTAKSWKFRDSTIMQYHVTGKLVNEVVYSKFQKTKTTYVIDAAANITGVYKFRWDSISNIWDSTEKQILTYTADSLISSSKSYFWSLSTDSLYLLEDYQYSYTKGPNNVITELLVKLYQENIKTYRNLYLYKYTYNNKGEIAIIEQFDWNTFSSTFKKEQISKDITWYKFNSTYNNSLLAFSNTQQWKDTAYVDSYRITVQYDLKDNMIEQKEEYFNLNKDYKWTVPFWYIFEHTYSTSGVLLETIEKKRNANNNQVVVIGRTVYSDFVTFSGITENTANTIKVPVYPNPVATGEKLSIQSSTAVGIVIYSAEGKLMQTSLIENGTVQLNTNFTSKSLYYYQLIGKDNEVVTKGKLLIE